ncbi:MAG: thermonuclease family protein [Nitrosopumilaceae archaeon]|jgi:endonuclease YncB( thermonuclease family)
MVLRKIILVSFASIIAIGILAFVSTMTVDDLDVSQKVGTKKPKITEPENSVMVTKDEKVPLPVQKYIPKEKKCSGDARCISGFVTRVIDGDTIVVGDKSIRFALVNTPEWGDYDYTQAKYYIETICPVGSKVLVDEDDGQTQGSFGRIIAKIYCNELNLNEEILEVGHAEILPQFCAVSEFAQESWATKHGC